jgi:hypothetical protein
MQTYALEHPLAKASGSALTYRRIEGQWSIILTVNK